MEHSIPVARGPAYGTAERFWLAPDRNRKLNKIDPCWDTAVLLNKIDLCWDTAVMGRTEGLSTQDN